MEEPRIVGAPEKFDPKFKTQMLRRLKKKERRELRSLARKNVMGRKLLERVKMGRIDAPRLVLERVLWLQMMAMVAAAQRSPDKRVPHVRDPRDRAMYFLNRLFDIKYDREHWPIDPEDSTPTRIVLVGLPKHCMQVQRYHRYLCAILDAENLHQGKDEPLKEGEKPYWERPCMGGVIPV